MKVTGRQSKNIQVQTPKERAVAAQAGRAAPALLERVTSSEPIEYNEDAPIKEYLEVMQGERNPANSKAAFNRPLNKGDAQFFKHTIKEHK